MTAPSLAVVWETLDIGCEYALEQRQSSGGTGMYRQVRAV